MRSDFPAPRSLLPRIQVTPQECAARKAQMDRMLHNALDEYDRFRTLDHSRIDLTRWKLSATKDALRLYRERKAGSTGVQSKSKSTSLSMSDEDTKSPDSTECWEDLTVDPTKFNDRQKVKSMLMFGEMPGRAEDAIYAVLAESNTELAFVHTFLHDDAADSHLLDLMEGPTPEKPLHSLGYKWFVKRAPGGGRIIKHRDVLSLEYTGMTTSRTGEKIGYLLIESVDIPGFPDMKDRNCLRAVQSVCALVRQKRDGLVEVYMTGVVELSGKFIRPISSMLTAKTMFIVTKVMDLAMCKRLTKQYVRQRRVRQDRLRNAKEKPRICEICHQKPGFFRGVYLTNCGICGQTICTKCVTPKRVYFPDIDLGHYERVECCKPCVFATRRTRAVSSDRVPIKVVSTQRHNSYYDDGDTRSSSASRPRSSSASDISRHPSLLLPPTIEEESFIPLKTQHPAVPSSSSGVPLLEDPIGDADVHVQWKRNGSVESRAFNHRVVPQDAFEYSIVEDPTGYSIVKDPIGYVDPQVHRNRARSLESSAHNFHVAATDSPLVLRPSPSAAVFPASAPGGTYHLAGPPPSIRRTTSDGRQELYARMMELRRLAETSYYTTQQNRAMMQQHRSLSFDDLE